MRRTLITVAALAIAAAALGQERTTTTYRGMTVRTPDPYGEAGLAWQNNFKAMADRIGNHIEAAGDPTANDDEANTGGNGAVMYLSTWRNTTTGAMFVCIDATEGAADWSEITSDWSNVAITGGAIDGATIGGTTPAAGAFSALSTTGNVGLGTPTPATRCELEFADTSTTPILKLENTSDSLNADTSVFFRSNSADWSIGIDSSQSDAFCFAPAHELGANKLRLSRTGSLELCNDNQALAFGAAGAEDFYIMFDSAVPQFYTAGSYFNFNRGIKVSNITVPNNGGLVGSNAAVGYKVNGNTAYINCYDDFEFRLWNGANYINSLDVGSGATRWGAVGIGGACVAGYPITAYQRADAQGLKIFGYDDRSASYAALAIDSSGVAVLDASGGLTINEAGADVDVRIKGDTDSNLLLVDAGTDRVGVGEAEPDYKLDVDGSIGFAPGASVTPADNGDVVFELTNDTTLTIRAKGSDGVVRSVALTLAP